MLLTYNSRGSSVLEADWGNGLGSPKPYLGRDPPAGEVIIMLRCKNGDLEVMVSVEKMVLDRLKQGVDLGTRAEVLFVLHVVVAEKKRRDAKAKL